MNNNKPGIKYLNRTVTLINLMNNALDSNEPNSAYNILYKMRTLHGKLLFKLNKILISRKRQLFAASSISSILNIINSKIMESEMVFNKYITENNVDISSLTLIRSKSGSKNSSKNSSKSGSESGSESLSETTSNSISRPTSKPMSRPTSKPTPETPSKRIPKSPKRIHKSPKSNKDDSMPLFDGAKSLEVKIRENIQSGVESKKFSDIDVELPSLILFYSPTCPACINTKPHWNKLMDKFKRSDKLFNIIELNLQDESNEKLATLFNVEYIPTIIMMESSKKPQAKIEKIEGAANDERIRTFISESYKKFMTEDN